MRFGLIGHPINHSKSPELFRKAFGSKHTYELIEGGDFEKSWKRFLDSFDAVNVTAPFKERAAASSDIQSPEVAAIGAANICVKTPEGIKACNSDYLGVKKIITSRGLQNCGRVLVIGFGGAGRAAAAACRDLGMDIVVCNRSTDKAACLRPLEDIPSLSETAGLIIYTLPAGIPQISALAGKRVLEANYRNPSVTDAGEYISGEVWLKAQAECGFPLMIK